MEKKIRIGGKKGKLPYFGPGKRYEHDENVRKEKAVTETVRRAAKRSS
ncbi:hypothetical protein L0Y49_04195 [bacterium]|nr:hypothetical protein [bacterium]MCI0565623.1 hypothetical protein [bacterium]MCI0680379.1 hypothetical protein [bacterium]